MTPGDNGAPQPLFPRERRTSLPGGYMGRILRVDLSTGSLRDERLPEEPVLRTLWGGQLLAEYILLRELPTGIDAYSPQSLIVGMAGPITGTGYTPGGTKLCTVYLSPATRYTLGRGATSGFLGVALKAAGYDGFIITGVAPRPSYLYFNEGRAELRDASRLWGKGTRETEETLRAEVGYPDARVGCIGPAGEHLVRAAMLVNDAYHNAAHGVGGVMGSKRLKAIVAWGTQRPVIADRAALVDAGRRWTTALQPRVYTARERKTSVGYGESLGKGGLTRYNWRSTLITDENRGFDQNTVAVSSCFQCSRQCRLDVTIGEGQHTGTVGRFNGGSEWMDTFYNLGFKGNDVWYLAERLNDLGIECSHFANGAGLAFEAWEKGVLGPEQTDGLVLEWGNLEATEALLERCARRQGWLGNLLADGPKDLALALGGEALQWVVHTKGGTPAQHEWRPLMGQMLRELVGSGGMKPQGAGGAMPAPDLRSRETWGPLDPLRPEGWARSHFLTERSRQACGIMGGCWFALNDSVPDGLASMVDALNATTGWDVDLDELLDAGHRSILLQSLFGTQRGWKPEHDWTDVGPRFLEPVPDGPHQGFTIARFLPNLVLEYYALSGRHPVSGRPSRDVLERLGLGEFLEWSHPEA
ncbi:MAG: hypothetical protein HY690_11135 [Chloroflexi bacterium]|nr:hypothetical protein [Chloroflexota bacterium]